MRCECVCVHGRAHAYVRVRVHARAPTRSLRAMHRSMRCANTHALCMRMRAWACARIRTCTCACTRASAVTPRDAHVHDMREYTCVYMYVYIHKYACSRALPAFYAGWPGARATRPGQCPGPHTTYIRICVRVYCPVRRPLAFCHVSAVPPFRRLPFRRRSRCWLLCC